MKKIFSILASLLLSTAMWAQTCGPGTSNSVCSYGPVSGTSGQAIQMPSNGGLVPGFNYVFSSGTGTVTLQACIGPTTSGCVTLDSYTGGSTVRTPDEFTVKVPSAAFQYFIVTPTFASGTFTVLEVNNNTASAGKGSSSGGGSIADTTNVLKGDGAGNAIASSVIDDGTHPTKTPNGATTGNKGLSFTEQPLNASSGTVANETICFNGSFQTAACPTTTTFGVLGIAGVGAGNSGNVDNCTTQCQVFFDGASVVGDWAIPSTTTAGYLHDIGSTTLPTNAQAFLVDSVASGAGQLGTVDVFTPYVLFSNQGRSQIIQINGGLSAVIANFNGTTPSAPGGSTNVTWQTSTSGGTTSISGYIATGLSNVVMPAGEFASSITSGVETVTKQNQQTGYVWAGPQLTGLQPFVVQSHQCSYNATGQNWSCSFNSATNAGHYIGLTWDSYQQGVGATTVVDNLSDSYTKQASVRNDTAQSVWYYPNATAGITTLTVQTPASIADNGTITIYEIANAATSSPVDVSQTQGFSIFSGDLWSLTSVTTTVANDLIFSAFASCCTVTGTYTAGPGATLVQQGNDGAGDFSAGMETFQTGLAGAYTPSVIFPSPSASYTSITVAIKPATSLSSDQPFFQPIFFQYLTNAALPGLQGLSPSSTAGDTQIDMHIGNAINAEGTSSAYAGNNAASTLYTIPSLPSGITGEVFECAIYAGCHTSVGAATVTPSILWTDESGTAETYAGSAAACTTLGTNSYSTFELPIRAKSNTTIYAKTALSGSAVYDFHAHCALIGIN